MGTVLRNALHLCILCVLNVYSYNVCKVPNGGAGTCIKLSKCPPLQDLDTKQHKTTHESLFLQQSLCGHSDAPYVKVCCPSPSLWTNFIVRPVIFPDSPLRTNDKLKNVTVKPNLLHISYTMSTNTPPTKPEEPNVIRELTSSNNNNNVQCGIDVGSSNKISGGKETGIDQYPWLALLEYPLNSRQSEDIDDYSTNCGGSLLNSRYVLTAAHCIHGVSADPKYVRLAEYDKRTFPTDLVETDGGGWDKISQIRVKVERTYRHPGYNKTNRWHDIGLVKLASDVEYTDFIKPICLPNINLLTVFNQSTIFILAGWGTDNGRFIDVKSEVSVPYVPIELCRDTQSFEITKAQICAGGEKGKDSCEGDSGGPLMYIYDQRVFVAGVVSYGLRTCGTEGAPAVYTNVYEYMPWIESVMNGRS